MKKAWEKPTLEVLEVAKTMFGDGLAKVDLFINDGDESHVFHIS